MKKTVYYLMGIITISFIFSISSCNSGSDTSTHSKDTTGNAISATVDFKNLNLEKEGDTLIKGKKIIFVNKRSSTFVPKDIERYSELGYETYDKNDFVTYYDYFQKLFKIGKQDALIKNYMPFPYSIYEKYSLKLQKVLSLQNATTTPVSMPGITLGNFIRIYPAIDKTTSELYLVLLGEYHQPGYKSKTLTSVYYKIKSQTFDATSNAFEIAKINDDIKNFQSIWSKLSDPGNTFAPCESFVYSIASYNELLGTNVPFWNLDYCKTDLASADMNVMLIPIIDASDKADVRFRLVAVVHRKIGNSYFMDMGREFFDNMYPCPSQCPSNRIK